MAVEPPTDLVDRARDAARRQQPPGWIQLSETVMSAVRAAVIPSDPVLAHAPDGSTRQDPDDSRTLLAARVLSDRLGRALRSPQHAPDRIVLDVDDEQLRGVRVDLVCSYGSDLHRVGAAVAEQVCAELRALLGPAPQLDPSWVEVRIVDVVAGDPRRA